MFIIIFLICFVSFCTGEELTFELPDNEKMCFYEEANDKVECVLEYQVITGGNYDVDVELTSADGRSLYKEVKRQYDSFHFTTHMKGENRFCFSNEFSSFIHKLVYFDYKCGSDEDPIKEALDQGATHHKALTQMESSSIVIHENLKSVIDYQTHHRLKEAQGEEFAENLNERVHYWSAGQAAVILLVGIGQIIVLRSFFTDKR
ncbi:hypothetical protein HELRODRAFT_157751 [Helobdella robusta]|uniref:GOLD domain-containing protein n=1 Tax=Helobdella robusta TaxID=6412 RepID=T1EMF4_HELRO|nr:hypothetical protein HELRODRAFT_157751 [Helobdella robusta]ESN94751.1 hypothetical protein HELRODRAFT_157751 [Helobdella robusta]